ncbi:MAG: penicillin-binding protein 1A [Proteobacteria bacterium]|nr:penicillin-binding protein 1A [Pseudomonadota bacterium]
MDRLKKIAKWAVIATTLAIVIGGIVIVAVLYKFGAGLPDVDQLTGYEPPVTTRFHAADGRLLEEYAREKRLFVPIEAMPSRLVQAFLAAEDGDFYKHNGIDYLGIVRAMVMNLRNYATDRRLVGASTITQQVAKNFLLTNEVSYERKIKEAILAYRIEKAFTKDEILELYLNEIFLGRRAYGVAAAALSYFGKSLNELTLDEIAYLAALPKAPNNYHPVYRTEAAIARRNWVLGRMETEGFVTEEEVEQNETKSLTVYTSGEAELFGAAHFNEEVRRALINLYGENALYEGGLSVRTTLDPLFQTIAERVLRDGLITYDRRHGWRGAITKVDVSQWHEELKNLAISVGRPAWQLAAVISVDEEGAIIGFANEQTGRVPFGSMAWARPWLKGQHVGAKPNRPSDVVSPGDVIVVEKADGKEVDGTQYTLQQIPAIDGALVAMDPHTGRVLALVGGFDYQASSFNRATQALRQPGSAFKPFVYATALERGFTPSDQVLDAPFVVDQGPGLGKWKPSNYSREFYGPSTLRLGIEKSRNLMTVRLAQEIGMDNVADVAERFGIFENMQQTLAMSLGAGETTLLKLTTAYAMLVNGGKRVEPSLIDRIQNRRGKTIFQHDSRPCEGCQVRAWQGQSEPKIPDNRERVIGADTAYQVVSMLEGVVQRGTGVRIRAVGKPLAGKTGTTNDSNDAWFVGFGPDLAVGVFAGFDQPASLGARETGSNVTAPIFRDFMQAALNGRPGIPFRIPEGIRLVRVNSTTGEPSSVGGRNVILEAFKVGTEPSRSRTVLDGSEPVVRSDKNAPVGTGGLY